MNKLSLALALGTGLTLGAAPAALASSSGTTTATVTSTASAGSTTTSPTPTAVVPSIQTLSAGGMSADTFNALFKPDTTAQTSTIDFNGAPNSGTLTSQVFAGGKAGGVDATGLYAYAYQVAVNNVTNAQGEPTHVDGASWQFNATPSGTNLTGAGTNYAYTIKDGAVGGLAAPTGGSAAVAPANLSWQAGTSIGSIRATYVDPTTNSGPLTPGETSATFVVLSTQPPASNFQYAGVLSSNPQTSAPAVYSPSAGKISPIPSPEPATMLAWAGMIGAAALARRTRKARLA